MGHSFSHRFIESPGSSSTPLPIRKRSGERNSRESYRLWGEMAARYLHSLARERMDTPSPQRTELRAVADQHVSASLGKRLAADPFVALLGDDRLPHKPWWKGLVAVDDAYDVWRLAAWSIALAFCVLSWGLAGTLVYYLAAR